MLSLDQMLVVLHASIKKTWKRLRTTWPCETENEGSYEIKKRNISIRSPKHIGPSLDDFLKEEGVLEETRAVALKETLAWQVQTSDGEGQNHQSRDGSANEHKPRRA